MTLALSPIALVSIVQGIDRANRDGAEVRERLIQTARAASTSEQNILAAAEQIARAMANLPEVRNVEAGCRQDLADALRGVAFFSDMARVDTKSHVVCSASDRGTGLDLSRQPIWKDIARTGDFRVTGEATSGLTSQPAILGMLPITGGDGRFQGAVVIAIDVHWLDDMLHSSRLPKDSVVAVFGRGGHIIAANHPRVAQAIFGKGAEADGGDVRFAPDAKGRTWTCATSPLLGKNVLVGFAMRRASLFGPTYVHVLIDFGLPFLMLALTWLAIWVVTERQLTRWIVYLARISETYRRGHYSVRPKLEGAPKDFQQLGSALAGMAESIEDRDRRLRDAVAQKTVLIREIHHRVKNNLQIVMSLLSLQANQLHDASAQAALQDSRARINALALVHRILHELEDQSLVDLKRLLEDLTVQTREGFGDRHDLQIETDILPRYVSSALAVPLALFTVEALTNVFKHAFPRSGRIGGTIRVTLRPAPEGRLRLAIEDNGVGFEGEPESVGTRLIQTFGQQVGGTGMIHSQPGKGTTVELWFPDPDLPDAETDGNAARPYLRVVAPGG